MPATLSQYGSVMKCAWFCSLGTIEGGGGRGAVAQSVERATPGEEVLGSIPSVGARSLLVGSLSV